MINLVDNDKSEVRATVRPVSRTLVRRLQIKALVTKLLRVVTPVSAKAINVLATCRFSSGWRSQSPQGS